MRILSDQNIDEAIAVITSGGIVAHATETCYGFACDVTNLDAVRKLFALKNRPEDLPVISLFSSVESMKQYVAWSKKAEELADAHWPGPLTMILPLIHGQIFPSLAADVDSLAVRISPHPIAQKIGEGCGFPISSTSANLHGMANTYSVDAIIRQFDAEELQPDLILDSGKLPEVEASTIVRLQGGEVEMVRQGAITIW